jgi:hypothetical protein
MCQSFRGTTIYMECLEFKCLDYKIWNFYVKCLEFENLKTKMSELGCVNT